MKNSYLFILTVILSFSAGTSFGQFFNGYALFNEMGENTVYLIDRDGNIAHSWSCNESCNYSVKLKDNGNIVRGGIDENSSLFGPASGGILQEIDPGGNIVWEFDYSSSDYLSHHDLEVLPNGNVLLSAWETKTSAELTQAGYVGSVPFMGLWPVHIIEVAQNGSGGQIVWEWHIWDHLVQDEDPNKDNYGDVASNPQLMDINAVEPFDPMFLGDWFHVNGMNYNEDLDQIVFTSRTASEFFVIDHSTTTAEAASHSGGNSGMGGDFLYRWGNPSNYDSGSQTIPAAVHDPRWIEDDGRPNGGHIQFFNNEGGSGGNSAIDAIDPPVNGFLYTMSGSAYGPASYDFRHDCLTNSSGQSSHDMMSNGNLFVNVSGEYMYELDLNGTMFWQYPAGPAKAFRYECDHPGIIALLGANPCGLSVSEESLEHIEIYPNPSTGLFNVDGVDLGDDNMVITVLDVSGTKIIEASNVMQIDLSAFNTGVYFVELNFNNERTITRRIVLTK